jgi:DNA helicase II / ATP-dependent DNA helicase PcrA
VGTKVRHPQFGPGVILALEGGGQARARVSFRDAGVKTLVLEFARLEKVG